MSNWVISIFAFSKKQACFCLRLLVSDHCLHRWRLLFFFSRLNLSVQFEIPCEVTIVQYCISNNDECSCKNDCKLCTPMLALEHGISVSSCLRNTRKKSRKVHSSLQWMADWNRALKSKRFCKSASGTNCVSSRLVSSWEWLPHQAGLWW
jgi:hypothetical protein